MKCAQFNCLGGGEFLTLDAGHRYLIKNRSEGDAHTSSAQVLSFMKIEGGVVSEGAFTQDVLAVLADRIEWQGINSTSKFEAERQKARDCILQAISHYMKFTELRYNDGIKMTGHTESEIKGKL